MVSFSLMLRPLERLEPSTLRPLPRERERDRVAIEERLETEGLERMLRPLPLTEMLEKEGCRTERTERADAMVSTTQIVRYIQ